MVARKLHRPAYWLMALVALILISDTIIVRTAAEPANDSILVYAVMFDFMLVIPCLYWLFILRAKGKSIVKAAPLLLVGAFAAAIALPQSLRGVIWRAAWPIEAALIAAELAVIGYELRIVYRFVRQFRLAARRQPDTAEALRTAMRDGVGDGKWAKLFLHDLSMLYYLLFSWGRKQCRDEALTFTYHRRTQQTLYAAIMTKIILLEGIFMHLLLQLWSSWAAWILTAADLWLLALIWADSRASFLQPIRLSADGLKLRYGLRIQADIPPEAVLGVTCSDECRPSREEQRDSAVPILAVPNVRIELTHPMRIDGFLFLPRQVKFIYLALDDPKAFTQAMAEFIDKKA